MITSRYLLRITLFLPIQIDRENNDPHWILHYRKVIWMSDSFSGAAHHIESPQRTRSQIVWFILARFLQRLIFSVILILGVIFFVAFAMSLARGGGYTAILEATPLAWDATIQFLDDAFGGRLEAMEELGRALPKSLGLLGASLFLGVFLGILFGGLAALYRNSRISTLIINGSIIGISTPSYVAAMFLIWTVVWIYQKTDVRILPVYGFGWDLRMIMPTLVLATRPMANITRLTYTAFLTSRATKRGYTHLNHCQCLNAFLPLYASNRREDLCMGRHRLRHTRRGPVWQLSAHCPFDHSLRIHLRAHHDPARLPLPIH